MTDPADDATHDAAIALRRAALQTSASILALQGRAQQEQRRLQAALEARASEQAQTVALLGAVLGAMTDGIVAVDNAGVVTAINPRAAQMLGLPAPMLARTSWAELAAHVEQQRPGRPAAATGLTAGSAPPQEPGATEEIAFADGRVIERRVQLQQIDGVPAGTVVVYQDITARKAAESAMRQAQADTERQLHRTELSRQVLLSALEDQQLAEVALRASQSRLQATLDALPDLMFEIGLDGRYHDYRAARADLLAAPPETFLGRPVTELLSAQAAVQVMAAVQQADATGYASGQRYALELPQGQRWYELSVARKQVVASEGPRFIVLARDITERRQSEAALRQLLADREVLLKEVHHRVKNNLQVIHSLLRLEGARSGLAETRTVLQDMCGRIQSMALLHESIYRTEDFTGVDLASYLRQVATQAFRSQQGRHDAVRLQLALADARLGLDQALPCGLLVSELVTNSLKHAFPDGRGGELQVRLQVLDGGAALQLQVGDDGVGLPADFAARSEDSLGMQLVADLAEQLEGRLEVGPAPAAVFTLTFRPAAADPPGGPP